MSVDETPLDETPLDETPLDETPLDEAPVDEAPADEMPVAGTSAVETAPPPSVDVALDLAALISQAMSSAVAPPEPVAEPTGEPAAESAAEPSGEAVVATVSVDESDSSAIAAPPQSPAAATEAPAAPAKNAAPATLSGAAQRKLARQQAKAAMQKKRELKKKKIDEKKIKDFQDYFDFRDEIKKIPPHRVLAINRGERARVLRVKIESDLEAMTAALEEMLVPPEHPHADYLRGCARDALSRLILPSLEREVRRELTDHAEAHAVACSPRIFATFCCSRRSTTIACWRSIRVFAAAARWRRSTNSATCWARA